MDTSTLKITFSPLDIENLSSTTSIKLTTAGEKPLLFFSTENMAGQGVFQYQTVLSSISVLKEVESGVQQVVIPHLLPSSVGWDIILNEQDSYSVVYDFAGGALNTLVFKTPNHADITVNTKYPLESFTKPRFIKNYKDTDIPPISAISNSKNLVVFLATQEGQYDTYKALYESEDGVILQYQQSFVVFHKVYIPGPVRGNDISRSILHCTRVDKDFNAIGAIVLPFGNTTIFEFDVDLLGNDEEIVIFATTERGIILATGNYSKAAFNLNFQTEKKIGRIFTAPAILATASHIYLALLESALTERSRVLIGSVPLSELNKPY